MGISVAVEELPEIGEWITFTMCDHTDTGLMDRVLPLITGEEDMPPDMAGFVNRLTCQPTAVPMHVDMVKVLADNLERALPQVSETSSLELILATPTTVDNPKIRVLMGISFGLVIEVRVDEPIMLEGTMTEDPWDSRSTIRGSRPWDSVPEFLANLREELGVYLAKHPETEEPDDSVGAEA